MAVKLLQKADTGGRDVLLKVDFNVPLKKIDGMVVIGDDSRIRAVQSTIDYFKRQNPKRVVVLSHLGKPKGKIVPEMSLAPVAARASELWGLPVEFVADYTKGIPEAGFVMLENVRFDPREKSKQAAERQDFARELCDLVDEDGIVVFDAFGAAHREHASSYDIMRYRQPYAGFLMQKELQQLKPFIRPGQGSLAILAGAKVEDKIEHVERFLQKYSAVLLGGGMVFTFYKALGYEIGNSLLNPGMVEKCRNLLEKYGTERGSGRLILPSDIIVTRITGGVKPNQLKPGDYETPRTAPCDGLQPGEVGLDIGPTTVADYRQRILSAKTIYWNGPMGVFEVEDFQAGTQGVGLAVAESGARKIAGGGDTLEVLSRYGLKVPSSTGGGASSDLVANGTLPSYEALKGNFN